MKKHTIKAAISVFILLFTVTAKAQLCYNSFDWPYQSHTDTVSYSDSITYKLTLRYRSNSTCNNTNTFSDNLIFAGRAYKFIANSQACSITQFANIKAWNKYQSTSFSININSTSDTIVVKIPLNQNIGTYISCNGQLQPNIDTNYLLAGEYTFWTYLTDYGNYNFGSSDTAIYSVYINNPLCKPYFQVAPTSTQGVYTGYNLSTGNNLKYLWDFGDGDTSNLPYPSHNYSTPGKYYVCLMVTNTVTGCLDQFCDSSFIVAKTDGGPMSQLNILAPTGIAETKALESAISLFPNPATNQLTINANGTNLEGVRIFNSTSQLVLETKLPTNTIDISHLTTGIYIAEIKTKASSVMKRWVKM